jgi:hypothetical protein
MPLGQADVLDIVAEMKKRVVQVILFGSEGKLLYRFVEPDTGGVVYARPRFVAELALPTDDSGGTSTGDPLVRKKRRVFRAGSLDHAHFI